MEYSYEDKLEMAKELRDTSAINPNISPELEKFVDLVNHEEKNIETSEGNTHIYIITPMESKDIYPLYINLHGGGFVRGHKDKDTILCSKIALNCGCKVIDVDYKVAPEYPFPVAFNECYYVVNWVVAHAEELHIDKEKVVLGGYSAGASFTAAIALKANKTKDFKLKRQIINYALLDMVNDEEQKFKAIKDISEHDTILAKRGKKFAFLYLENENDKSNLYASPILATKEMLMDLPPALIIVGGKDFLRYENQEYAMKLVDAGVEVKIKKFVNSNHGLIENFQPGYEEAHDLIIETLKQSFYND